jgi:hypothetical protein
VSSPVSAVRIGRVEVGEQRPTGRAGDVLGGAEHLPAPVGQLDRAQPAVAGHRSAHRELPCLEVVDDPHHRHPIAPHALDQVALGLRPVLGDGREHTEVAALDPERSQRLTERAGSPGCGRDAVAAPRRRAATPPVDPRAPL